MCIFSGDQTVWLQSDPKSCFVLHQLRGLPWTHSHRLKTKDPQGNNATINPVIIPWTVVCHVSGHSLSLIPLGTAETHKTDISKTDGCVHTAKCNSLGSIRCKSRCNK